jgi:uncharacterized protein YecE (DUF72 family)
MIWVGTSGWLYPPWRGTFYPKGVRQKDELAYLSQRVTSIELNSTFYSLKKPEDFRSWAAQVPPDFVFAIKGSRFVTHMKRLLDPVESMSRFWASGVFELGPKLGPFLWQLPPNMTFDAGRLQAFFDALPRQSGEIRLRHALEVRHESFKTDALVELLARNDVALVLGDSAGRWPVLREDTADFRYVRLHGDVELYTSGYTDKALDRWAEEIRGWGKPTWVYFDNDVKAHAPHDAMRLIERLG